MSIVGLKSQNVCGDKEMLRPGGPENEDAAEEANSWWELDSFTSSVLPVLLPTARLLSASVPLD